MKKWSRKIKRKEKRKIGEYIEKNAARQQKQVESFHKREDAG